METNDKQFKDKTILITGCNRGIGRVAVERFAQEGAKLICCIRNYNEDFCSFVNSLTDRYGVNIEILYFDMSDETAIKEALTPIIKQRQRIDVLVNNAGIATGGFMQMTSMAELHKVFQINFFSQVYITQLISKLMARQKSGVIVNMGSVAGIDNFAGYTSYGSSKAALMFFTKTIARELAAYNIRVNAIAPGLTDTGMAGQMESKAEKEMIGRTSMNRLGSPIEIAETILFLASDKSSFITGQTIRCDGGM